MNDAVPPDDRTVPIDDDAAPMHAVDDAAVQRAVERFVRLRSRGEDIDPQGFAAEQPAPLQQEVLTRCREFLAFDDLLGPQHWQADCEHDDDLVGSRRFGDDFVILEELGRGGMGVVYLARQRSLERDVALKVMQTGLTLSNRHVERFRREAMATAQLRHPAIVPVHTLVEVDGTFALVMDFVPGRNLADVIDDLRLRHGDAVGDAAAGELLGAPTGKGYVAECAMLTAQIASTLAAAHEQKVVHRDLKPRNLMLDDRRQVRLLDFGLAKSLDATRDSLSMSGELTGTAHYLSPEGTLAKRVAVDHRADIWALGVILYELLTLRRPFEGKNLQQIVYSICFQEPTPLQKLNPKVPRDLVTICQKALEKDPQKRYADAAAFEADLQRFLRWEPIHARPASTWTRCARFVRRHRREVAAAAVLAAIGSGVGGVFWVQRRVDAGRADELLRTADARAAAGRVDEAITLGNRALELRNDASTRERLERFQLIEMRAAWQVARSQQLLDHDRAQALQLALDAERRMSNATTRSAVLDALGAGHSLETLPTANGGPALATAWSPSGHRVAVGGYGELQLFERDPATATLLPRALAGHAVGAPIVGATFADDDTLVSLSPDRTLRIWALANNGARAVQLDATPAAMWPSGDRTRLLLASYDDATQRYQAEVRALPSGERIGDALPHDTYVTTAAISDDGRACATSSHSRNVRLWSADRTAEVATLPAGDGRVRVMRFSGDGRWLAAGCDDGTIALFDVRHRRRIGVARHPLAVTSLSFRHDGTLLLSGSRDHTARLWRRQDADGSSPPLREVAVMPDHDGPLQHVAFAASGSLLLTATARPEGTVRVFHVGDDANPGVEPIARYELGETIEQARFADDSPTSRILLRTQRSVRLWDCTAARGVVSVRQPGKVPALAFIGSGSRVLTAGDDERLRCFDSRDGRQLWVSERVGNPVQALAVTTDGNMVACALVGGGVQLRRCDDGAIVRTLATADALALAPVGDDRLLIAGRDGANGHLSLWPLAGDAALATRTLPAPVQRVDVDKDGTRLVAVCVADAVARLFSLPTLDPAGQIASDADQLTDACFSPDGATVLTAARDGIARLHHAGEAEAHLRIRTSGPLRFARFAGDGELLLTGTGGDDGNAQLWQVSDGRELLHFEGHRGALQAGAFRHDAAWIATCASDGTTCVWPTDPVAVARGDSPPDSDATRTAPADATARRTR